MKKTVIPMAYDGHPLTMCERRGHKYHLTTGVWTCRNCKHEIDRDCRAGCIFAADGINCEDVIRCAKLVLPV